VFFIVDSKKEIHFKESKLYDKTIIPARLMIVWPSHGGGAYN